MSYLLPAILNPNIDAPFTRISVAAAFTTRADLEAMVATAVGAITVSLPASPANGTVCAITDADGSGATNHVTVNGNGHNIDGSATQTISSAFGSMLCQFDSIGGQWRRTLPKRHCDDKPDVTFGSDVGGAGGGGGGGGSVGAVNTLQTSDGAGGFLAATNVLALANTLIVGTLFSISPAGPGVGIVNVPFQMAQAQAVAMRTSAVDTNVSEDLDFHVSFTVGGKTATLPAAPATGRSYEIKSAGAFTSTINGNGHNIDGAPTYTQAVNRECTVVRFNTDTSEWEIS